MKTKNGGPAGGLETRMIGDLCQQFGLTLRALRFYEDKGLLKPLRRGMTRHYTTQDVKKVKTIVALRKFGFHISEIADFLQAGSSDDRAYPLTEEQCRKQLALLRYEVRRMEIVIEELSKFHATLSVEAGAHARYVISAQRLNGPGSQASQRDDKANDAPADH